MFDMPGLCRSKTARSVDVGSRVNYHLTVEFVTLLSIRVVTGSNLGTQISLHSLPLSLQAIVMTTAQIVYAPWLQLRHHTHTHTHTHTFLLRRLSKDNEGLYGQLRTMPRKRTACWGLATRNFNPDKTRDRLHSDALLREARCSG